MTQTVALCALGFFALIMVSVGLFSVKHTQTLDGFLLGGRKVGAWMSAFAYGTSYFSAVIFIGYAGKFGWDVGFSSMWIGIGNAVFGCLAAWMILAKRTRAMTHTIEARTMPEFFEGRYGDQRMKIYAAIIIFIFLVPYAASVYKGLGTMFGSIFPSAGNWIPGVSANTICMFIVAILTAFYLVLGGYVATAITDFIQGIIMIGGVIIMVVMLVNNPAVGGLSGAVEKLREVNPSLLSVFGGSNFKMLAINILLTSFGCWGLPQMIHKFYAIKDEGSIKKATVVSTGFALLIGCGAYFVGTFGHLFVPATANGTPVGGYDSVVPKMLMAAFGNGLAGNILLSVILLLVLSASMSTLSAIVLTSSSAITIDLLQVFRPECDGRRQMRLTRLMCLVFVALSFVFATANFAIIVSIMSFSWGVVSGCFIGPYLWGLYSKKVTRVGAWCGMIGGLSVVVILTICNMLYSPELANGVYAAFKAASSNSPIFGVIAMAFSLIIVPVVSRFTKKLPQECVERAFAEIR